jgi:hypothetical protein
MTGSRDEKEIETNTDGDSFLYNQQQRGPSSPLSLRHGDRTNSGSRRNRVSGVVKVFSLHHHAGQGGKMGRQ